MTVSLVYVVQVSSQAHVPHCPLVHCFVLGSATHDGSSAAGAGTGTAVHTNVDSAPCHLELGTQEASIWASPSLY